MHCTVSVRICVPLNSARLSNPKLCPTLATVPASTARSAVSAYRLAAPSVRQFQNV